MSRQVIYDRGGLASTIDGILKDDYVLQQIIDVINRSTVLFSRLRTQATTHGRKFIFAVQLGTSQGVGARPENVQLPNPGFGEYEQAHGNVKYLYSTLYITGPAIEATRGNRAAFADALKQALKDARDGLKLDMQRQVWGDGSGCLGTVAAAVSGSNTVTVTNPYGLTYHTSEPPTAEQSVRLFKRHMSLFFDDSTPVVAKVVGVNPSADTITLDQHVTVAQGVKIYRGDSGALNNKDGELLGLPAAISATGTYLGISRTGKPEWQGHLVDCDGPLSLQAMRAVVDTISIYGTTEPDLIITDHLTRSRYEALLTSLKRFVNPMQLEGGFKAIEFDGLPIVVDKDAPPQRMWFLNTRDWLWYSMKDIGWLDRHGAILHPVPDMDAWKAYLTTYRELVCRRPNNQAVLYNIIGEEPDGGNGEEPNGDN